MTTRMSPFERREDDIDPRSETSQLTKMIDASLSRRKFLGAASVMTAGAFMLVCQFLLSRVQQKRIAS